MGFEYCAFADCLHGVAHRSRWLLADTWAWRDMRRSAALKKAARNLAKRGAAEASGQERQRG